MAGRIIIHAGFHKTGTSSVQRTLKDNRPVLKPYLRSVLRPAMTEVVHAARGYSTWRDPLTLGKFATRFAALLQALPDLTPRALCLSAEELSGHLPGRGALTDYSAAADLATEMAQAARARYARAEIHFFYSTRDPDTWLQSAYWQHVRHSSLTLGWEEYAATYRASANLEAIVEAVRRAQPHAVHSARLEDHMGSPAGPATPLLRLCGVPGDVLSSLALPPPVNRRPDKSVLLALLSANRDYPDRDERRAAKQAILQGTQEDDGE